MQKFLVWATAGLFTLSLQGAALAQNEGRAPEVGAPQIETKSPMAPVEKPVETEQIQQTSKKRSQKKTKSQKSAKRKHKTKKAKSQKKVV